MCSTASDSLKWYMTFLVHPERLWLSKSEINTMITPSPQPLRWANGTINPSSKDASGFAQGMSTHGSPDTAHGVSHHHGQQKPCIDRCFLCLHAAACLGCVLIHQPSPSHSYLFHQAPESLQHESSVRMGWDKAMHRKVSPAKSQGCILGLM